MDYIYVIMENEAKDIEMAVSEKNSESNLMQWVFLVMGIIFSFSGGALKLSEIKNSEGIFQFVFFNGGSYILMVLGIILIIISLGYDILFEYDNQE